MAREPSHHRPAVRSAPPRGRTSRTRRETLPPSSSFPVLLIAAVSRRARRPVRARPFSLPAHLVRDAHSDLREGPRPMRRYGQTLTQQPPGPQPGPPGASSARDRAVGRVECAESLGFRSELSPRLSPVRPPGVRADLQPTIEPDAIVRAESMACATAKVRDLLYVRRNTARRRRPTPGTSAPCLGRCCPCTKS